MPPPRLTKNDRRLRALIAQEAARIMHEESVRDYRQAKDKACFRLAAGADAPMPRNEEVQAALEAYLRVFKSEAQMEHIQHLRLVAQKAMRFLAVFEPHLVGAVLKGTADPHSAVHLHVFAETVEELLIFLYEKGIPHEVGQSLMRYPNNNQQQIPGIHFIAGGTPIELSVFPYDSLRHAPCSPVDGKPVKRMSLIALDKLMSETFSPEADDTQG